MADLSIRLRNYRAFRDTGNITLKPLTFLVGENRTGKSSVLAALNFLFRFREDYPDTPSINSAPFDLGSFEQIIHQGKKGAASKTFSLEYSLEVNINGDAGILSYLTHNKESRDRERKIFGAVLCEYTSGSMFGNSEITEIDFEVDGDKLHIFVYPRLSLQFYSSDGRVWEIATDKHPAKLDFDRPTYVKWIYTRDALFPRSANYE